MQIVDVRFVLRGAQADGVGGANDLSAFDAAAGQPHAKAVRVVVAAVAAFAHRHAAELAAPHHERAIEQAAGL